jgi:hypothetical protein
METDLGLSFEGNGFIFPVTPAMELMQYVENKMWALVHQYNLYQVKGVRTVLLDNAMIVLQVFSVSEMEKNLNTIPIQVRTRIKLIQYNPDEEWY